jgi:hypothetical protein
MAQLGLTTENGDWFGGIDGEETGLEDSKGRPLVVGDVVSVFLDLGDDYNLGDPKNLDKHNSTKTVIAQNHPSLSSGNGGYVAKGHEEVLNSEYGPVPDDGTAVIFDHHLEEGEVIRQNGLDIKMGDVTKWVNYLDKH